MEINRKALLAELQWVNRFADKKVTIPALSNVMFEADGVTLQLTGTNLEVAGIARVQTDTPGVFKVAAPVRKMIQYLQKLDDATVDLTADSTKLTLRHSDGGTITIGMDVESYPEVPQTTAKRATIRNLPEAIERTSFAISPEESRFTLNGALLEATDAGACMVATDGHRMSLAKLSYHGPNMKVIIPRQALSELGSAVVGDCQFVSTEDFLFFSWQNRQIVARKLTGNFPDYPRVMTQEYPNHIMVPVKATEKAASKAYIYADERSHAGQLSLDGDTLTVMASSFEVGECTVKVPISPGEVAADLQIGLNLSYVLDFLRICQDEYAAFCWRDKKSGTCFTTGDGWQYLVMPMRI